MPYLTPELLLVGAAQHLVLEIEGQHPSFVGPDVCEFTDNVASPEESDYLALWQSNLSMPANALGAIACRIFRVSRSVLRLWKLSDSQQELITMSYLTPELLLVGAAKHLVLEIEGKQPSFAGPDVCEWADSVATPEESDYLALWQPVLRYAHLQLAVGRWWNW